MVFWTGILVGAIFMWLAIKVKFYEAWAIFFNIVISTYLAVYLRRTIIDVIPASTGTPYSNALIVFAVALGTFLVLHGITFAFFTGQFSISMPKIFDILGAGLLGFLAGFLVWSFVSLLICIMPISQNIFVKEIGFVQQFEQTGMPYISWWCNLVNAVVSPRPGESATEQAVKELLDSAKQEMKAPKTRQAAEPPKPPKLTDPNIPEPSLKEELNLAKPRDNNAKTESP